MIIKTCPLLAWKFDPGECQSHMVVNIGIKIKTKPKLRQNSFKISKQSEVNSRALLFSHLVDW